ncbi:hypothetical protein CDCA_CDCA02G0727 [Cyanidium caldarium]|uniref:ATP-grasp domain-containing protein n=1 Tax=Cyanidium caldarium TaxID=2771 RepID=A0AAV9IQQ3_CYACA|nr:hypothetical protein CDCA_CDCA02G0727 [Cyanidium caldarium]
MSSFTESLMQRFDAAPPAAERVDFALNRRKMPSTAVERLPGIAEIEHAYFGSAGANAPGPSPLAAAATGSSATAELARSLKSANFMPVGSLDFSRDDGPLSPSLASRLKSSGNLGSPHGFSPVFSSLPAIRPHALERDAPEVQTIRRKLLRGAQVLIFQAGYSGKRFVYEHLRELGVRLTILDGPESWAKCLLDEDVIEAYIELDFTDFGSLFERALDAILDSGIAFDAVATFYEDAVAIVARIAEALHLPGNPREACDRARNKRVTREIMRVHGLPTPKFMRIDDAQQLEAAAESVGFPAILKPVFGAASMGVHRVESMEDLQNTYAKVRSMMNVETDTIWAQGNEMMLEEFYDGDEFDADVLMSQGKVVYVSLSDNWACWEPWYQETGMNIPSIFPPAQQTELVNLATQTLHALGFTDGAFHVELKYTSRGPRIIEVNARMGGMCVRDANLRCWGVDLVEEHVMTALGIPIRPPKAPQPLTELAQAAVNAPYSGVIDSDDWLEELQAYPECKVRRYLKPKGARVVGPEEDMPDWIAELIFEGPSVSELLHMMEQALKRLRVPIQPLDERARRGWFFPSHAFPFQPSAVIP